MSLRAGRRGDIYGSRGCRAPVRGPATPGLFWMLRAGFQEYATIPATATRASRVAPPPPPPPAVRSSPYRGYPRHRGRRTGGWRSPRGRTGVGHLRPGSRCADRTRVARSGAVPDTGGESGLRDSFCANRAPRLAPSCWLLIIEPGARG